MSYINFKLISVIKNQTYEPTKRTDMSAIPTSSANDFDFFMGTWKVRHTRLKERLNKCNEWQEFSGSSSVIKILGGQGNMDDNVLELPEATYRAATFRTFDAQSGIWSIWWLDGRYPTQLDTPMRGHFEDGVGYFFADDVFAGQPIRVRFLWTPGQHDQPRWEQAFSVDGGETWETNWIMDFQRVTV